MLLCYNYYLSDLRICISIFYVAGLETVVPDLAIEIDVARGRARDTGEDRTADLREETAETTESTIDKT